MTEGGGQSDVLEGAEGAPLIGPLRIDEQHFAVFARRAASDQQLPAVAMIGERLNALRQALQAAQQLAGQRIPERDFILSADRQFLAIRRKRQREDRHRQAIVQRRLGTLARRQD